MEQSQDRVDLGEVFRATLAKPKVDPDTGKMSTYGEVFWKRHQEVKDLMEKVLKKAEDEMKGLVQKGFKKSEDL